MKRLLLPLLFLLSINSFGQENKEKFDGHNWKAPYYLPQPEGWGIERFLVPIEFAPSIPYKGVEDIRFTPGWGKQKDDQYWSYAFLWYLDGKLTMETAIIQDNLREYYTGLLKVNTDPKKTDPARIIPVKTLFVKLPTLSGDIQTFSGTIEMTDFMQLQPIILNCTIHLRFCDKEDKTYLFHELSPQPFSNIVWTKLDQLWAEFNCKSK